MWVIDGTRCKGEGVRSLASYLVRYACVDYKTNDTLAHIFDNTDVLNYTTRFVHEHPGAVEQFIDLVVDKTWFWWVVRFDMEDDHRGYLGAQPWLLEFQDEARHCEFVFPPIDPTHDFTQWRTGGMQVPADRRDDSALYRFIGRMIAHITWEPDAPFTLEPYETLADFNVRIRV